MAAWGRIEARIYNDSLVLQGTITSVITADGNRAISSIGDGSFVFPWDDSAALALVSRNRIANVRIVSSIASNGYVPITTFIIRKIDPEEQSSGIKLVTVSGPGILSELTYDNILYDVIGDGALGPSTNPVFDALAYSQYAWSLNNRGLQSYSALVVGKGESVFETLLKIAEQSGCHFGYSLRDVAVLRQVEWFTLDNVQSAGGDFQALTINTTDTIPVAGGTTAPRHRIVKSTNVRDVFTRGYFYGSGTGDDRFTLAESTTADPAGFTTTAADSLIVNNTLEAVAGQPQITIIKQFPGIEPEDPTDSGSIETAANQLKSAAIEFLQDSADDALTFYDITTITHTFHVPGQVITITHSDFGLSGAVYMIHEIALSVNSDGHLVTHLRCGDTPKKEPVGLEIIAQRLRDLDTLVKHSTASGTGAGSPGGTGKYLKSSGSPPNLSGNMVVEAGITIDGVDISAHAADPAAHHTLVTLGVNADAFLQLTGQAIGLDSLAANLFIASPDGSAGVVSPRAIADGDIPSTIARDSELHAAVTLDTNANAFLSLTGQAIGVDSQAAGLFLASPSGAAGVMSPRAIADVDLPATIARDSELHTAVSLATNITSLLGLSTQELSLDTQAANLIFAGPVSGAAAAPTFRAMVAADLLSHDIINKHTTTASQYQIVGATATSTLGLLTPSTTGTANAIARFDANGRIQADGLGIGTTADLADAITIGSSATNRQQLIYRTPFANNHELLLRPTNTSGVSYLRIAPNGSPGGINATCQVFKTDWLADSTNFESVEMAADGANNIGWIRTNYGGTGTLRPLAITTGAAAITDGIYINAIGSVFIGDTANAFVTRGLTINQGAADDKIMEFKSSDVAHGITTYAETDTFGGFGKYSATAGGLNILGHSSGSQGMVLQCHATTPETTDTSASYGVARIISGKKSGTSMAALAATENVFSVDNWGSTRLIVKGNGDLHVTNTTLVALDEYDDVALLRTLDRETAVSGVVNSQWDKFINYNRKHLEEIGVLCGDFISIQALQRLTTGAIWQLHERIAALEAGR